MWSLLLVILVELVEVGLRLENGLNSSSSEANKTGKQLEALDDWIAGWEIFLIFLVFTKTILTYVTCYPFRRISGQVSLL